MPLNILVVEDDNVQFNAYTQALDDDSLDDIYTLLHAENIEKATKVISENTINGAILDLNVPNSSGSEASPDAGIGYLKNLLREKQFPIAVVSANVSSLSESDIELPKHLKKFNRETGVHSRVFEYFEEIKDLLQVTPAIPMVIKEIQDEFQKSFWELWGHWNNLNARFNLEDPEGTKTFLKRYVSSYLIEKWMANDLFNKMHHTEFYTHPPVKERVHTGDILNLDGKYWVVVTAPCDLSNQDFPDNLTLLQCEEINFTLYKDVVRPFRENSVDAKKQKQKDNLRRNFTDPPASKHYLPPWKKDGAPLNVLFKGIKTVPFSEADREQLKENRVATLSTHFLPYLLQRYGAYVSRIGQADIAIEGYMEYLLSVVPHEESNN